MSENQLAEYRKRVEERLTSLIGVARWFLIGAFVIGGAWSVAMWQIKDLTVRSEVHASHFERIDAALVLLSKNEAVHDSEFQELKKSLESRLHGISILTGKSREDIKRTINKATED